MVSGLQLGNVFVGVQPLLGLEGDPMRLMFERDLTPHPQYAAYYQWLKSDQGFGAQVNFNCVTCIFVALSVTIMLYVARMM